KFSPVIKINSKGENILGHTAPFPEEIPEMAVKFFSYIGDKILDPFAGSFTTAIVAKKLNRIAIGVEINKNRFRENILKNIRNKLGSKIEIDEYDYL
ncbi:MAG: site-specific DNA-methyltransferase, partial [Actinobacteria bacterium]|nr:site-specific DNA-methyltransferase [Actinomycetota bacterium]